MLPINRVDFTNQSCGLKIVMDRKCWDPQTGQQVCHDGEDGWFGVPIDKNICAEYLDRCAQLWHEHWGNISGVGSRTDPNPVTLKEDARKKVEVRMEDATIRSKNKFGGFPFNPPPVHRTDLFAMLLTIGVPR